MKNASLEMAVRGQNAVAARYDVAAEDGGIEKLVWLAIICAAIATAAGVVAGGVGTAGGNINTALTN